MSIVLQLATIGDKRRLRAAAVTMHLCERCVRRIYSKTGRKLRHALALAVQSQAMDLARQRKESNAA